MTVEPPFVRGLGRPGRSGGLHGTPVKATVAAAACLCGMGLTALLAMSDGRVQEIDDRIVVRLHAHDSGAVGSVSRLVAGLGDPLPQLILAAGAVLVAFSSRRVRLAVVVAVSVAGADLTTQILKVVITANRYEPAPGLVATDLHSFPSGHVTALTAMTFAWVLVVPRRMRLPVGIVGGALTGLVGIAVVVLHDHWPSDVVGGALVAGTWGFGATAVLTRRR